MLVDLYTLLQPVGNITPSTFWNSVQQLSKFPAALARPAVLEPSF